MVVIETINVLLNDSIALNLDSLGKIVSNTKEIVKNTSYEFWWDGVCFIGIISLVISLLTVISIVKEFNKDRIDKECQKLLFHDIIRHLYRNKVCTLAMRAKYSEEPSMGKYPSDEHYLKLKLLPSDIHTEQFYKDAKKFARLHEMDLLLRNYNTEIEVAYNHMLKTDVPEDSKMRDFDMLDYKTGYLTWRIIEVMKEIWPNEDHRKIAMNIIANSHKENVDRNRREDLWGSEYESTLKRIRKDEIEKDYYFRKIFNGNDVERKSLQNMLDKDTIIECGKNETLEEKIYIIKCKNDA